MGWGGEGVKWSGRGERARDGDREGDEERGKEWIETEWVRGIRGRRAEGDISGRRGGRGEGACGRERDK